MIDAGKGMPSDALLFRSIQELGEHSRRHGRRYSVGESVMMEERSDGMLLRPIDDAITKHSWRRTAKEMAAAAEDWSDWDTTTGDGLDT
jgi:hypothetical protein